MCVCGSYDSQAVGWTLIGLGGASSVTDYMRGRFFRLGTRISVLALASFSGVGAGPGGMQPGVGGGVGT